MGPFKSNVTRLCLATCVAFLWSTPVFASVIISSNNLINYAWDGVSGGQSDSFSGTAIPTSQLLTATDGTAYSKTQIDYSAGGSWTTMSYALDQQRPGAFISRGQSFNQYLTFSVDVDSTYDLSGDYTVTDVTTDSGQVLFNLYLYDETDATYLAYNRQESRNTTNESFTLGLMEGDYVHEFTGSLTGDLLVGHQYRWFWQALTQTNPDADGGASAVGNITLTVHDANPIPEPATFTLFAIGLAGLCAMRRRRKT